MNALARVQALGQTPHIERLSELDANDLHDICNAADEAIREGGGFGWVEPPIRNVMEQYWQGLCLVPGIDVWLARLDGVLVGSIQLKHMPANNQAQRHIGHITTSFVAPWARGHGLARGLLITALQSAQEEGLKEVMLDVRETQKAAIHVYESLGFSCWGTHPRYALVNGSYVAGRFYSLELEAHDFLSMKALPTAQAVQASLVAE